MRCWNTPVDSSGFVTVADIDSMERDLVELQEVANCSYSKAQHTLVNCDFDMERAKQIEKASQISETG